MSATMLDSAVSAARLRVGEEGVVTTAYDPTLPAYAPEERRHEIEDVRRRGRREGVEHAPHDGGRAPDEPPQQTRVRVRHLPLHSRIGGRGDCRGQHRHARCVAVGR